MGQDKALLQHDGRRQLDVACDLLGTVTERVFVSAREDQADDAARRDYPQVIDRHGNIGPLDGILSALESCPDADWLVLACDLPNLDRNTLEFLCAQARPEDELTAFRSEHDGLPEPLCAIYRADARPTLHAFLEDGIVCPRKILIRAGARLLDLPNPAALDNINTPADLEGSRLGTAS